MRGKLFSIVFLFLLLVSLHLVSAIQQGDSQWDSGTFDRGYSLWTFWCDHANARESSPGGSAQYVGDPQNPYSLKNMFEEFENVETRYDKRSPVAISLTDCETQQGCWFYGSSWYELLAYTFIYVEERYEKPMYFQHHPYLLFESYSCGENPVQGITTCAGSSRYCQNGGNNANYFDLILEKGWNMVTFSFRETDTSTQHFRYNNVEGYSIFSEDPNILAMNSNINFEVHVEVDCANEEDGVQCGFTEEAGAECRNNVCVELNCNDGIDNDGDGFIDMADKDCYNQIDLFDINGPVSFNMGEVYGTTVDEGGFVYWNASALNGSDGVCGDDNHTGICVFNNSITCEDQTNIYQCMDLGCTVQDAVFLGTPSNYYCNLNPTDLEYCYSSKVCDDSVKYACKDIGYNAQSYQYPYHSAIDEIPYFKNFCAVDQFNSQYVQKNVLNLSHLNKEDAQIFCNSIWNAEFKENYDWLGDVFQYACTNVNTRFYVKPSFLWDSLETCYNEAREPFRKIEFPLPREGTCSEVTDLRQAEHMDCTFDSFNCTDMPTYSECAYRTTETCTGFCEWQGIEDFENDLGYVSQGGRYFCNKNYKDGMVSYLRDGADWHWWDARNYDVTYKINGVNKIDFISNSAEWYYCAANNTENSIPILEGETNALPISEGKTFSLPSWHKGYSCVELLNAIEANPEGGIWTTCDETNTYSVAGNDYYCNESLTNVCDPASGGFDPITFESFTWSSFQSSCEKACYMNSRSENLENIDLRRDFCDKFPFYDTICAELNDPTSTNDLLLKKDCTGPGLTTNNCLNVSNLVVSPESCVATTIPFEDGILKGKECPQITNFNSYCYMGDYLSTNENEGICCLVEENDLSQYGDDVCGYISTTELSELTCNLMGGSWAISTVADTLDCFLGVEYSNADGTCCVGGDWSVNWYSDIATDSLKKPEAFVCYKHGDSRLLSECCNDFTPCFNYYPNPGIFQSTDQYYLGVGGATHTIENFDKYAVPEDSDSELLFDFIRRADVSPTGSILKSFISPRSQLRPDLKDFSSFDYLEFDIVYPVRDPRMYLELSNGSDSCNFSILTNTITGDAPFRWHHVVLDLSSCDKEILKNITTINIKTLNPTGVLVPVDVRYSVLVDALVLTGGEDNSPNYYCTGNFGSWITNLDGPTDIGFLETGATFNDVAGQSEGYGKYWYACEAQAAFDWTGRRCCGDDTTTKFNPNSQAGGEYYTDLNQGCFHGVPIPSGRPVSYSFNEPESSELNKLMFYNGEFYGCQLSPEAYHYKISYDGVTQSGALVSESKEEFDVIGDYICFEQNWIDKNDVEVSKILLAKMYDLTFNTDGTQYDFEIMCDEPGDIATFKSDSDVNTIINSMCVLRLKVDEEIYTLTGLNFNAEDNKDSTKTNAQYFMEKLIPDLNYSKEFTGAQIESLKTACNNNTDDEKISAFSINPTQFFQTCGHTETDYRFAYNPSLNILFIMDAEELGLPLNTNLYDLMQQNTFGEFLRELWNSFLGLFTGWFGGGTSAGGGILDYTAYMPTFQEKFVQFDKVYLAKFDEKHIKALMETRKDASSTTNPRPNMYFVSGEYQGFGTQVQKLAENYYNDNDYAMNYAYGSDGTQLISLVLKQNDLTKYTYQNNFDWKRLTSGLMVNPDVDLGWSATSLSGNCQIDLGEECDTCDDGSLVFNLGQTIMNVNCEEYDNKYDPSDNLQCSANKINLSNCREKCGTAACDEGLLCMDDSCVECVTHERCQQKYNDSTYSCDLDMVCRRNQCMLDEHCDSMGTTFICLDKTCVEKDCTEDVHCETPEYPGSICRNYQCVNYECTAQEHCTSPEICELSSISSNYRSCVQCTRDNECNYLGSGYNCVNNNCLFSCDSDFQCAEKDEYKPVCKLGNCVECTSTHECTNNVVYGDAYTCDLSQNKCIFSCTSNSDCDGNSAGNFCDNGDCVECNEDENCVDVYGIQFKCNNNNCSLDSHFRCTDPTKPIWGFSVGTSTCIQCDTDYHCSFNENYGEGYICENRICVSEN